VRKGRLRLRAFAHLLPKKEVSASLRQHPLFKNGWQKSHGLFYTFALPTELTPHIWSVMDSNHRPKVPMKNFRATAQPFVFYLYAKVDDGFTTPRRLCGKADWS
jgi:hypothetical protein